jgi:hypothetical protein
LAFIAVGVQMPPVQLMYFVGLFEIVTDASAVAIMSSNAGMEAARSLDKFMFAFL